MAGGAEWSARWCGTWRASAGLPIRIIRPAHGASLHYAGTLPCSEDADPLTTALDGRLHGSERVYVADASTWRYLPAKGPTLTLMANAYRVGSNAASTLREERA